MSISRVNPSGWGVGDKLTSAQANGLDQNTTYALDKRSGQTDTLASVVSCSGAGRIVDTYAAGADADTTYLVSDANAIIDVASLTADRIYTLSNTNAIAGDRITVLNRSSFYVTVKNAASSTLIVLGNSVSSGESAWAEFLYTGTAWVLFRSGVPSKNDYEWVYTSSGSFTAPRGVYRVLLLGCGGGGGGGGGRAGTTGDNTWNTGGGGGGGARFLMLFASVTPLSSYDVTIGDGGLGGDADRGADGGDTLFRVGGGGAILATFPGAKGGGYDGSINTVATRFIYTNGGTPNRHSTVVQQLGLSYSNVDNTHRYESSDTVVVVTDRGEPGHGGPGVSYLSNYNGRARSGNGNHGVDTFAGGIGGTVNSPSGSKQGGGGGGGGGAGPFGNGANGGNGGAPNSAGAGGSGGNGSNAGANTGAGGGGGGSGGFGSTSGGAAGVGGNGGSGKLIIVALR